MVLPNFLSGPNHRKRLKRIKNSAKFQTHLNPQMFIMLSFSNPCSGRCWQRTYVCHFDEPARRNLIGCDKKDLSSYFVEMTLDNTLILKVKKSSSLTEHRSVSYRKMNLSSFQLPSILQFLGNIVFYLIR